MPDYTFQKGIKHIAKADKQLSTIIKNIGNRNLRSHRKYFNLLLETIIGQQLSVTAAASIQSKLFSYFEGNPTPEKILDTDDKILRSVGLSNAKGRYVKDLAQKVLSGELKLKGIAKLSDEQVIAELTKVKGIGVWSAHMFLIFNLARLNVLAAGDLGIKRAVMLNYRLKKIPTEQKIEEIARRNNWYPYCTVACIYLWESLKIK